jgi:uncharacterized membrane protein YgcG
MVKYVKFLVAMMVTMFATSAMAWTPPASPKPTGNIVDLAGVLHQPEMQRLNAQLKQINSNSANEIGVLILPSLDGQDIRDVGISTAKAWGVGKQGLDNGVMVVWSPGDRKIGIETGKGVEGDLPDLTCNDIIRKVMGPQFRQKNYEVGLSQAFVAISGAIEDHRAAVAQRDRENAARGNGDNAATSNGTTPQTSTTPQSGSGCDVAGTPGTHAGLGMGLLWLLGIGGLWLLLRGYRASARRREQEELAENQRLLDLRRQELDRLTAAQDQYRRERAARVQPVVPAPVVAPVPFQPIAIQVVRPAEPIVAPTATVSTIAPTWEVAQRIRQEQEEERTRQARLRQLEQERQEREVEERHQARLRRERAEEAAEEAAAAAAIVAAAASSNDDDNDDDDDSPSGSDSSDTDFGGGDFGGGGSADSY